MSNVYARNRKETSMQFFVNALELQVEITKYVMKEEKKNVIRTDLILHTLM